MGAPSRVRGAALLVAGVVLLGVGLRLMVSVLSFSTTFDTATPGLMALRILKGELPLFYYGQDYMGALESYVAALFFLLCGVSTTSLSLSPIAFAAGWIAGAYALFRDLLGPRAGIAAALCTAACGWYPLWFSLATYGGYAEVFCIGTWCLFLAFRIARGRSTGRRKWGAFALLGLLSAVGIWVNLQVLSYLVTAAAIVLLGFVQHGFKRSDAGGCAVAAGLALLGTIPAWLADAGARGASLSLGAPSPGLVRHNLALLLKRCLPELLFWPWPLSGAPLLILKGLVVLLCIAAVLLSFSGLRRLWRGKHRLALCVVPVFVVVFLALYLPHPMAGLGATRYLVPLQMMVICSLFAYPLAAEPRWIRRAGGVLLTLWIVYNTGSALVVGLDRRPTNAQRRRDRTGIARSATRAGLEHVMIVGSAIDGHHGQILTFYARDRVRFVSPYDERHGPSAQQAELNDSAWLLCKREHFARVSGALEAAGVTDCKRIEEQTHSILHDFTLRHDVRQSIPPDSLKWDVDGAAARDAAHIFDRTASTELRADCRRRVTLTIQFAEPREIDGFSLTAGDPGILPDTYAVHVSPDGDEFHVVQDVGRKIPNAYVAGNRVYVMGHYARRDSRFVPVRAKALRVSFMPVDRDREWAIGEMYVFASLGKGGPVSGAEVAAIANAIERAGLQFVAADRWISARLGSELPARQDGPRVYPRSNPLCDPATDLPRVLRPNPATGFLVAASLGRETELLLQRALKQTELTIRAESFAHYTLFWFEAQSAAAERMRPQLKWNGYAPLLQEPLPHE